ncbi:MAG: flagellar hook-length control protein FliK [Hyphomonas sp.]
MTFSVDVDFWLFQAGPRQDATARQSAGEGRGKDFASSLFGVASEGIPSPDLILGESAGETLSALNLLQAPAFTAPSSDAEAPVADPPIDPEPAFLDAVAAQEQALAAPQAQPDAVGQHSSDKAPLPTEAGSSLASALTASENLPATGTPPAPEDSETAPARPAQAPPDVHAAPPEIHLPDQTPAPTDLASKPQIETMIALAGAPQASKTATPGTDNRPEPKQVGELSSTEQRPGPPVSADAAAHPDLSPDLKFFAAPETAPTASSTGFDAGMSADSGAPSQVSLSAAAPLFGGSAGQAAVNAPASVSPVAAQMTPTHAVLTATATQLPDIVARATSDGQDDRILVQLDPPELGRVSIDFKFDAQGLQFVTITAESPEAMRQLRQMHFELVQALERNGLSGQNLNFQNQTSQQNEGWGQSSKLSPARFDTPALTGSGLIIAADSTPNRQSASSGRLDIRL